ncbi:neuropeptide Y receptor type 2-like [Montipora capricornis]|uniref:neuropeptide Y receptor type 2-like n=1 Tax=Montipora capricornis TaxID=246305 RepID=UPI0035F2199C
MATNSTNSTGSYENSTNSSFSRDEPLDRFKSTAIRAVFSLQLLVALVGIIGNIIVCVITSKKRNLKIAGNHFILNLALADLGILVIYYPLHVVSIELSFSWPFGKIACQVIRPFFDIFFGAGICCITAIGFYRYRMLVYCTKPRMNVQAAKRILVVIWLLPFIIIVMPLFWVMELQSIPKVGLWICQANWPNWISFRLYKAANNLAFYFFPLAIITSTYVRIRNKLRDNIRRNDSYRQARSRDTARKDVDYRTRHNRRALRLLTPVVVIFAICMAPGVFMTLLEIFSKDPRKTFTGLKYMEELRRFFQLLIVVNSSANPIIYSVVNSEFRRDLARLIRCDKNNYCFTDSTEGLSLSTFRKSSSIGKKSSISFSSFKRRSTSSKRGSKLWSSRNFADKLPAKADQEESFAQSKEEERKGNEEN